MRKKKQRWKPCPFCGKTNKLVMGAYGWPADDYCQVECENCETDGPKGTSRSAATKLWNKRLVYNYIEATV